MLSNVKFDIVINLYQVILYLTPCEAHIVSPLSSNTSTMGPIYKSTLLFGLLASKNPLFEKIPILKNTGYRSSNAQPTHIVSIFFTTQWENLFSFYLYVSLLKWAI